MIVRFFTSLMIEIVISSQLILKEKDLLMPRDNKFKDLRGRPLLLTTPPIHIIRWNLKIFFYFKISVVL